MEQLAFLQKRQKLRRQVKLVFYSISPRHFQEAAKGEVHVPVDLFGGTPLGILPPAGEQVDFRISILAHLEISFTASQSLNISRLPLP